MRASFLQFCGTPPHYIDLALKDVFEGKTGSSNEFFQRLVKCLSGVDQMFQRGKMLSHAKEMATNDDLVFKSFLLHTFFSFAICGVSKIDR